MTTTNSNLDVSMQNLNLISSEINPNKNDSGMVTTPENSAVAGVSGISNVNDTTTFVDDAEVMKRDESSISHINASLISLNDTQAFSQNIMDFLQKPIVLATGNFSITDTYSFLNYYNLPRDAFNATQGVMWKDKLKGYFGIRMDMRVRLVINANRFQQGRYCVGWVPMGGMASSISSLKAISFNNMHMATLTQRTTVPHVEIDLATGTSAELLIPFVSSQSFFPLNSILSGTDISTLGFLNVYPYSPLVSPAGSTTASYTVYISFENIHLIGASSVAQSGYSKTMSKNLRQSEIGNKGNGPISSVSSAVSRGFKEFSSIPLIGSICNDVSWVADRITGVASIFGFSKPAQGDSSMKTMLINATNHTTVDGDSDARSLALLSKSGVTSLEGISGTIYDEMDFSYLVRKYAWNGFTAWNTSNVADDVIASIDISPSSFSSFYIGCYHFTPIAFVSSFFRLWRGSFQLKFKFVKTEFHSGRLSFAFYPTDESVYTSNPAYVNRLIVDIRETTEVELTVPYISRTPWMNVIGDNSIIGKVIISVVDPLVAPATVSSSITICREVSGGVDFEVSIPSAVDFTPSLFSPQSGFDKSDSKIISATIGNSVVSSDSLISTSLCIGEKITSFRPFLRRFTPVSQSEGTAFISTPYSLNNIEINLVPDAIIATQAAPVASQFRADAYSIIASCYCLSRGGVRIRDVIDYGMFNKVIDTSYDQLSAMVNLGMKTNVTTTLITGAPGDHTKIVVYGSSGVTPDTGNIRPLVIQNTVLNNSLTVEIPQYTFGYARCIADTIIYEGNGVSQRYQYLGGAHTSGSRAMLRVNLPRILEPFINTSVDQNAYTLHNLYRAAADDASFSTFISVPPMAPNFDTVKRSGYM